MRIISWNVNGIRAAVKKGLADFLKKDRADIYCLQEIKIDDLARAKEKFDFKNYREFWHPAEKSGYSGTALLIKNSLPFVGVKNGLGEKEFDREGRLQTVELKKFYLVNGYFPNANHELSRLDYKLAFNDQILKYVKNWSTVLNNQ